MISQLAEIISHLNKLLQIPDIYLEKDIFLNLYKKDKYHAAKSKSIVIGANQGMVYLTGKLPAEQKNEVIMASKTKEKIESAAKEIGGNTSAMLLDYREDLAVKNFFDSIGSFDPLVLIGAGLPAWGIFT